MVRFAASAMPIKNGLERLLPKLRFCAAKISTKFSEQQAKTHTKDAPQAVA